MLYRVVMRLSVRFQLWMIASMAPLALLSGTLWWCDDAMRNPGVQLAWVAAAVILFGLAGVAVRRVFDVDGNFCGWRRALSRCG